MPRTMRAVIIHWNSAIRPTRISQVLPRKAGDRIEMIRNGGRISSRSTTHIDTRSVQPPKYPAAEPTIEATPVENSAASRRMVCANMSPPIWLVPNQCVPSGGISVELGSSSS